MTTIKLAEALLRRKELEQKVQILKVFKDNQLCYQIRAQRIKVTDGLEDLNADYPKLTASQVTEEYDFYASRLRKIDALIQQVNWTAEISPGDCMNDYPQKSNN